MSIGSKSRARGLSKHFFWFLAAFNLSAEQTMPIDIWAEEFEPLSYTNGQGEIDGMNTELVQTLISEAKVSVKGWQIAPWARAYKQTKENANTLLYSVARTPAREALFHWIGPISKRQIALYKLKSNTTIQINDWQDLRKMRIGSLLGAASSETLRARDLRLYEVSNLRQIVNMLLEDRIDMANMMNFSLAYLAETEGRSFNEFEQVWVVDDSIDFYIALNKQTSPQIVEALQLAFSRYSKDGRLALLHQKYLNSD